MMPETLGELFIHNGKLAQWRGHRYEYDEATGRAYVVDRVAVSNVASRDVSSHFLGRVPVGRDWDGYVYQSTTDLYGTYVDTRTWIVTEVETTIRKPSDSKRYTWKWSTVRDEWYRVHKEAV